MKKLFALLLALSMTVALAACGSTSGASKAASSAAAGAAASAAGSAASVDTSKATLTITSAQAGSAADSVLGQGTAKFAELVEQYSNGSIKVESYYGSELGQISAQVEGVFDGSIDVLCCGPAYLSGYVPQIQVFDLPFLFDNYDQAHKTLDGDPGQYVAGKFDGTGVKLISYFESGLRSITNSSHQIKSVSDLKGVKIRVAPSETQIATWKGFGAIPMGIDSGETFTALQQGTVDAQENGLTYIYSSKVYEAQKYLSLTKHSYTSMPVVANQAFWDSLTSEQQDIIQRAITDATKWQRDATASAEEDIIQKIADYGLEVEKNPDRDSFKPYASAAYDVFNKAMGSDELLKMVQDYVSKLG
jgi:tripartite ATP-independent transporter DctP family solute receptor